MVCVVQDVNTVHWTHTFRCLRKGFSYGLLITFALWRNHNNKTQTIDLQNKWTAHYIIITEWAQLKRFLKHQNNQRENGQNETEQFQQWQNRLGEKNYLQPNNIFQCHVCSFKSKSNSCGNFSPLFSCLIGHSWSLLHARAFSTLFQYPSVYKANRGKIQADEQSRAVKPSV